MRFHHIMDQNGHNNFHWYVDLHVSDSIVIKNILVDTGASISTLGIRSLARIYKMSEASMKEYLTESEITDKVTRFTATKDSVELNGVFLRDVKLDDTDLKVFKVYTRLDGHVSNLIGMDIISACHTDLKHLDEGKASFDSEMYKPDVSGAAEIKALQPDAN